MAAARAFDACLNVPVAQGFRPSTSPLEEPSQVMRSLIAVTLLSSFTTALATAPGQDRSSAPAAIEHALPAARATFVGRVLRATGRPAGGALVVTSAGGRCLTAEDGIFELALAYTLGPESVEVTAMLDDAASGGSLVASTRVVPPSLSAITRVGSLVLGPVSGCRPRWLPTFGGARLDGDVRAFAVFDDGSGPALYAGGSFTIAGGVRASHVARWDGVRWAALDGGVTGPVDALAVFDDGSGPALYVGGNFTAAGSVLARSVARWDGASWSTLGLGLNGSVLALAVFDDGGGPKLYAGGAFADSGGQPMGRIARWNGAIWTALGSGMNAEVRTLLAFDDGSGPALYAGGLFSVAGGHLASRIARWNGASWSGVGSGVNGAVSALASFAHGGGAALHAGGAFTTAGGGAASRVARWDGSGWSALAGGVAHEVLELAVLDDGGGAALYAAGSSTGGNAEGPVARWNGSSWTELGSGFDPFPIPAAVQALAAFDGGAGPVLFAGGTFTLSGDGSARHLARLHGGSWAAPETGLNDDVHALLAFDDGSGPALYAGGTFSSAGGMRALRIARFDGTSWSPVGGGLLGISSSRVQALASFDDGGGAKLYAGGTFVDAGQGFSADRIARWDGSSWSGIGSLNGEVRALVVFDDGSGPALYAGGRFTSAGGAAASRIAKWNGASWSPLGTGVSGGFEPAVNALAVFDDGGGPALYVGGSFTIAGGMAAGRVARWNGSSWSPLGTGVSGAFDVAVNALAVFDGGSGSALYVGGSFTTAGGMAAGRIARWNGSGWSALGAGMDASVGSLAVFGDGTERALHAGGEFTSADGIAVGAIARWDGSTWSALEGGVDALHPSNRIVRALAVSDGRLGQVLCAGGSFELAPSRDSFVAAWGCPRRVGPGQR